MSPIGKYFKNKGSQVLDSMQQQYGPDKGIQVFHAAANKHPDMKPTGEQSKKRKSLGERIAEKD